MNVLKISLDVNLLRRDNIEENDSIERRVLLARQLENLFAIVYSTIPQQKPFRPVENLHIYSTGSLNKITRPLGALKIGKEICRNHKIDLITTQDPFFTGMVGAHLAKKFNIPLNVQMHTNFIDNRYWMQERLLNRFMNFIGKRILKKADSFRVVASEEKERLIGMGYPANKIAVVAESIDVKQFQKAEGGALRKKYQDQGYDKILCWAGRLVAQKNLPMLFNAFKQVLEKYPQALLLMAGEGELLGELTGLADRLNITRNLKFLGAVPLAQLPDYFDASDVLVLSSNHEGGPRVVKEAAVVGIPVVTTAVGIVGEVVTDGTNGYIVDIEDVEAFVQATLKVLADGGIRERCRAIRSEMAEQFGRRPHIENLTRLWRETIGESA